MKALSVKQPWADLIISGVKDIENRSWRTHFRGRVYIHASAKDAREGPFKLVGFKNNQIHSVKEPLCFHFSGVKSAIIGEVDIIDCVKNHDSVWAEPGCWNWVLANAVKYEKPILNVRGGLSFWQFEPINQSL